MIDLETEQLIPLKEARQLPYLIGRNGNPISLESLNRWRLKGLRGVVLETVRIGGTIKTSAEAVRRFLQALNMDTGSGLVTRPATGRAQKIATADKRLDEAGF